MVVARLKHGPMAGHELDLPDGSARQVVVPGPSADWIYGRRECFMSQPRILIYAYEGERPRVLEAGA